MGRAGGLGAVKRLLADDRDDDLSLSGFDVAFEEEDLLPGSEDESAVADWDGDLGPEPGCLEVGVSVSVVPGSLVAVVSAWGHEPVEDVGEVLLEAGFEFDGADGSGAADVEDVGDAGLDVGFVDCVGDVAGDVVHVAVPGGGYGELILVCHEECSYRQGVSWRCHPTGNGADVQWRGFPTGCGGGDRGFRLFGFPAMLLDGGCWLRKTGRECKRRGNQWNMCC